MNRDSVSWTGPMPAVVTPFDDRLMIDERLFIGNIERLLDRGATGIVVGGCTGEFWALEPDERVHLFALGVKASAGRGAVIAGTGAIRAGDAISLTKRAHDAGCDGALILPPYFVKLTDDEIFAHYETVAAAVELPIVLYNIPGNAVNNLSPDLVGRLAALDAVVAVKESSGDWHTYYGTAIAVRERLRVFCGPSSVFGASAMGLGADGLIDCFPNMWLPGGLDLYHAAAAGRLDEARALQELGWKLTRLFTTDGRTLYPSTKAAMDLLGFGGGRLRPPLQPLRRAEHDGLRRGLIELGLLPARAAAA